MEENTKYIILFAILISTLTLISITLLLNANKLSNLKRSDTNTGDKTIQEMSRFPTIYQLMINGLRSTNDTLVIYDKELDATKFKFDVGKQLITHFMILERVYNVKYTKNMDIYQYYKVADTCQDINAMVCPTKFQSVFDNNNHVIQVLGFVIS